MTKRLVRGNNDDDDDEDDGMSCVKRNDHVFISLFFPFIKLVVAVV